MAEQKNKSGCQAASGTASFPCSFTIEAACSLTLFILCAVVLMTPMLMLNQHQNASAVLEENARKLAKYKYIEYYGRESGMLKMDSAALSALESGISTAALSAKVTQKGMSQVDLLTWTVIDDTNIKYVLNYNAQLPFAFLGLHGLRQQVVASRRGWVGAEDYRWGEPEGEDAEEETIVYVSTKRKTVYHSTLYCTYLSHDFLTAKASDIDGTACSYGGYFAPCHSCKPGTGNATVYYTDGGKRYHSTPTCKAMQSYIQETTLSKALAEGRHACVRCGK